MSLIWGAGVQNHKWPQRVSISCSHTSGDAAPNFARYHTHSTNHHHTRRPKTYHHLSPHLRACPPSHLAARGTASGATTRRWPPMLPLWASLPSGVSTPFCGYDKTPHIKPANNPHISLWSPLTTLSVALENGDNGELSRAEL